MLIEFRVSNFKSIAEEQVLSLVPKSGQKEYPNNIFVKGNHSALNAIAMYGANASGKSNLLLAMQSLKIILSFSAQFSSTTQLPYIPFLFKEDWSKKPTKFEITFLIDSVRYRYGLTYNKTEILEEWLFRKKTSREVQLFAREDEIIDVSSGFKGNKKLIETAIEATRNNGLFLSTCDTFNIAEAKLIFQWFNKFQIENGTSSDNISQASLTIEMWNKNPQKVKDFLVRLNLGFVDLDIQAANVDSKPYASMVRKMDKSIENAHIKLGDVTQFSVHSIHNKYDADGKVVGKVAEGFGINSAGTQKAFNLTGPILSALQTGGVFIIDEIEANMHPRITLEIIEIFLNPESNPNRTQLIFATHDTNLLTYSNLRRDQIYFLEKNKFEATEIYSLSDFSYLKHSKSERPDTNKEKRYLEGRYGAIPFISSSFKVEENG